MEDYDSDSGFTPAQVNDGASRVDLVLDKMIMAATTHRDRAKEAIKEAVGFKNSRPNAAVVRLRWMTRFETFRREILQTRLVFPFPSVLPC